jgi:AcrR family transcriptional regulator
VSASSDGRPGSYAKGRAKRQEIIETAMLVFGEAGYNKSSMLDIAERCSLSRAGLSHHFPSKESILEAVLAWRDQVDRERFRANGSAGRDGLGVLRGMVDLARHNATVPGLVGLYSVLAAEAASPEHPAHEYFVKRYRRIVDGTRHALEGAREAGCLREGVDPEELAISLVALMDGLQIQWLLRSRPVDMARQLRNAIQNALVVEL